MIDNKDYVDSEFERWFDVTAKVDQIWFRSYADELAEYCETPDDVRCEVWMMPQCKDRRVNFRNRSAWLEFVCNNWSDVEEVVIFQYGSAIQFALLNTRHCYVRLRLEGYEAAEANEKFSSLQGRLSLRDSHPYAYKYRRSSMEFKVGQWDPKEFAVGVNKIADLIGPNPHVQEAFVKSFKGDIEELTPFHDRQSFCEHIDRRANVFGEMVIQMRSRSVTVGIGVSSDHKKLRIRTSLPPEEVDSLIEAWPSELKLDQIKAVDTGAYISGSVPSVNENPWLKHGIPVLMAFITAASTAGLISLKKSVWPDYKISVASPLLENGKAKLLGTQLVVDWYLQPDGGSLRGINRNSIGSVQVLGASGIITHINSKSPVSIPLSSGDYILSIDVPDIAPVHIPLHVDGPTSQTSSIKN
ncbi:hypothetical protein ACIQUF_02230 [Pseudomonas sp. NPDC090233]|uniref:hypothetical protein n=1 Tax=Pseudomonas sp. NPDC090233 TaxID=3364479 RepID=UPI00383BC771